MTEWAAGFETVTLIVDDLPSARQFYLDVFELPVIFEDANSAVFRFGPALINLLAAQAADELVAPATVATAGGGVASVMTIGVPDVDALAERLRARGVAFLNGPMDRPWGVRTASFRDPAGHTWEIAAPIAAASG
jgi:lactoylglutathione lyase